MEDEEIVGMAESTTTYEKKNPFTLDKYFWYLKRKSVVLISHLDSATDQLITL